MDDSPLYGLILFIVFIVINALMYAFGEAVRLSNETDIEKKADEGDRKAVKIKKIMDKPDKFISTVHTITAVTLTLVGFFQLRSYGTRCREWLADIAGRYFTDGFIWAAAYSIVVVYLLVLVISLGILVPKRLGGKYSESCTYRLVGFASFVVKLFTPFTFITGLVSGLVLRIFGIDPNEEILNVTEEEIISIVNEGHEQGVIEEREAKMISNIMELDDKTAGDIMIHRKNITAVDGEWTIEQTVEFIISRNYSRFPVYIDNIDNIIGILHLRNAMAYYHSNRDNTVQVKDIPDILMEAKFIPESRNVDDLFRDMQTNKTHMQVVVDEYGQTSGIIAMEDILEEIVGNILDEYDVDEVNIVTEEDGSYLMKGMTTIDEVEDLLEEKLDSGDYDTLNGYLISKLDRIPSDGERPKLTVGGYSYQILSVKNKMIATVRVKKLETVQE